MDDDNRLQANPHREAIATLGIFLIEARGI